MTVSAPAQPTGSAIGIVSAATLPVADLLGELGVTADQGLSSDEVGRRQAQCGPNAVSSHRARLLPVLWHQLRSPLLALLVTAAIASYFVGERSGAVIIGVTVALSVGLGFVNEYRAEKAAEALHSQISHKAVVIRDGRPASVDVTTLVPGDLIELRLGEIVPADIRLIEVTGLECDESVLTGESLTVEKNTTPVPSGTPLAELSGCALMGTVVHAGSARGIVVATGARTEFGKIATGLCTENTALDGPAAGGNPLDQALWQSRAAAGERDTLAGYTQLAVLPFDHERRMVSVLVRDPTDQLILVTKGAPETILDRCVDVPAPAREALETEFAAGNRVVAVATRPAAATRQPTADDERGLRLAGLLVFLDPPKQDAAEALRRLAGLGIAVKVVTGDNPAVAVKVCRDLGLGDGGALTGADLDTLDDTQLATAIGRTTVFARVSPEDKARIVRVQRRSGGGVAFLGDGVNDALALHAADVGISVDSATDVAKDAADVILLDKDLNVLADGVTEGRRIFANTLKYVLMGTSSNFGNMFSAAGASLFLTFLPMLPSQILLNNLLYDTSQLAIPTDNVDDEQLRRPSHWDIAFIRRFMIYFGPLSSVFDFVTFGVMLWVFHSGPAQFRTGWFVESLATQTLVIFAIRTRRIPFFRSHPSVALTLAALGIVAVGTLLPATPLAHSLGFQPLPAGFFAALGGMVVCYLVLIEIGKRIFYGSAPTAPPTRRNYSAHHHLRRRAAYFSTAARQPGLGYASEPSPGRHRYSQVLE